MLVIRESFALLYRIPSSLKSSALSVNFGWGYISIMSCFILTTNAKVRVKCKYIQCVMNIWLCIFFLYFIVYFIPLSCYSAPFIASGVFPIKGRRGKRLTSFFVFISLPVQRKAVHFSYKCNGEIDEENGKTIEIKAQQKVSNYSSLNHTLELTGYPMVVVFESDQKHSGLKMYFWWGLLSKVCMIDKATKIYQTRLIVSALVSLLISFQENIFHLSFCQHLSMNLQYRHKE